MQSKTSGSTSAWPTSATVTQTCLAAAGRLATRSSPSLRKGCLSVSSQVPTVAPNFAALVPACFGRDRVPEEVRVEALQRRREVQCIPFDHDRLTRDGNRSDVDAFDARTRVAGASAHGRRRRSCRPRPVVTLVDDRVVVGDEPNAGNVTPERGVAAATTGDDQRQRGDETNERYPTDTPRATGERGTFHGLKLLPRRPRLVVIVQEARSTRLPRHSRGVSRYARMAARAMAATKRDPW